MPLLEVRDLRAGFQTGRGLIQAVNGLDLTIDRDEVVGLVGESGSGKSAAVCAILGLLPKPKGRLLGGTALFQTAQGAVDLLQLPPARRRGLLGNRLAMIFQDPLSALNPYLTIATQVAEPAVWHQGLGRREALSRAITALEEAGIPQAAQRIHDYPHQFSGGMRQRVTIAMALINRPDLLVADEPTTALDATVQAQILELLARRQREMGMAVLFITHNLGVVAGFCQKTLVLYAGRLVESGPTRRLFHQPRHPYTRALCRSIPDPNGKGRPLPAIPGAPPDLRRLPPGCAFAPRCAFAQPACREGDLGGRWIEPGRYTACRRAWEENMEF